PRVVAVIHVEVERGRLDADALADDELELSAQRQLVAAVWVVPAEINVVAEAVDLVAMQRHAIPRSPPERSAEGGAVCSRSVVTAGQLEVRGQRLGRLGGAHVDEPAERVRAVARPLRTAQHLDALDVEQRRDGADRREVDVVDQETDRRIRRALVLLELADAAQLKVPRSGPFAGPIEVRHE